MELNFRFLHKYLNNYFYHMKGNAIYISEVDVLLNVGFEMIELEIHRKGIRVFALLDFQFF